MGTELRRTVRVASVALAAGIAVAAATAPAEAGRVGGFFGADERLHVVARTEMRADDWTPLSICYKGYTYYVLAGVYTTSELVLCEGKDSKRYFAVPSGEKLSELQKAGLLPSPLPAYTRDWTEYAIGYLLWLLMAALALYVWVSRSREKREAENNLHLLKLVARRVMARMTPAAAPESGRAVAGNVYAAIFREPLSPADLDAETRWVNENPNGYEGFVKAIGRKLDAPAKALILRAAAYVTMADGILQLGGADELRLLAEQLGMASRDTEAFIATLTQVPSGPTGPVPSDSA